MATISDTKRLSRSLPGSALLALALCLIGLRIFEISQSAQSYVFHDVWRHMVTQVIPILKGEGSVGLLWYNMHANPSLTLHQLMSYKVFDFNLSKDYYLMLGLNVIMAIIIIRHIFKWQKEKPYPVWQVYILIAVFLLYFFGAKHNEHLMALHSYPFFFGTILALVVDRYTRECDWYLKRYFVVFALVLLTLFTHFSYGFIFCFAVFLASSSFMIVNTQKKNFILPVILLGTMAPYALMVNAIKSQFSYISHSPDVMPLEPAFHVLANWQVWYDLITAFPVRMMGGLAFDVKFAKSALLNIEHPGILVLFAALFTVVIVKVIFGIVKSQRPGGIFFLALFFTAVVISAMLPLSFRRVAKPLPELLFGWHYQHAYRYAVCGFVVILFMGLFQLMDKKQTLSLWIKAFPLSVIASVSVVFLVLKEREIYVTFENKAQIHSIRELAQFMYGQEENEIDFIENKLLNTRLHEQTLPYMFNDKVGVYSDSYRGQKELRSLKKAKKTIAEIGLENFQKNMELPEPIKRGKLWCRDFDTKDYNHNILQVTVRNAPERLGGGFRVSQNQTPIFKANIYTGKQVFYIPLDPRSSYRVCIHKDALPDHSAFVLTR